jgi:hypothetical protein
VEVSQNDRNTKNNVEWHHIVHYGKLAELCAE